jgi:hypothetical protein
VNEIGERVGGRLRPASAEGGEAGEHGLGFREIDIVDLAAVTAVPAERRPLEPCGLRFEHEQEEFERVRESDVFQVGRGGEREVGVARVERAAEASVGGALRGHEHMFASSSARFD